MAASPEPIVFVIDDDAQSGRAVAELVRMFGHQVQVFQNSRDFVDSLDSIPAEQVGCVITDLRMTGIDGIEVLQRLVDRSVSLPVIIVTAYAETAVTVRALRHGAVAVLDKPFRDDELWSFVQEALAKSRDRIDLNGRQQELGQRLTRLTLPDRQVLQLILEGCKNRTMAKRLDVSLRTIENRRRRIFDLMQAESIAELTRMVLEFEHKLPATAPASEAWLALPFERSA